MWITCAKREEERREQRKGEKMREATANHSTPTPHYSTLLFFPSILPCLGNIAQCFELAATEVLALLPQCFVERRRSNRTRRGVDRGDKRVGVAAQRRQ